MLIRIGFLWNFINISWEFHENFDQKVVFCENSMNHKLLGPAGGALGGLKSIKFSQKSEKFVPFSPFCGNAYNSNGISMIMSAPRDEKVPPGTDFGGPGSTFGWPGTIDFPKEYQ